MPPRKYPSCRAGLSLIELVMVLVILSIMAAIAIPRVSRGAAGATDSALVGSLRVLRSALELYATEHGGSYPAVGDVVVALTGYSNEQGTAFATTKDSSTGVILGPYLRAIPPLPVYCPRRGETGIAGEDGPTVGWIYWTNAAGIGEVRANTTTERDARNALYSSY
jgi:prepilin-type N-terminal cleavage/methylation domain-containing protein